MPLLPVLAFRNELPQIVVDELEQLVASINVNFESATGDVLTLQEEIDDLQDQIDDIVASLPHNLLSARHPDTIPDSPTAGAIIRGTPQDIETDMSPYWYDGLTIPILASELDPGDSTYWYDGLPISGMLGGLSSDVKWEKVDKGNVGDVWTTTVNGADWVAPSATGGGGTVPNFIGGVQSTLVISTATNNDVALNADVLFLPIDASAFALGTVILTGLTGGTAGRMSILVNVGATGDFQLAGESGLSVATNRFMGTTGVAPIPPGHMIVLAYLNGRWAQRGA